MFALSFTMPRLLTFVDFETLFFHCYAFCFIVNCVLNHVDILMIKLQVYIHIIGDILYLQPSLQELLISFYAKMYLKALPV